MRKGKWQFFPYYLSEDKFIKDYPDELANLLEVLIEVHPEVSMMQGCWLLIFIFR